MNYFEKSAQEVVNALLEKPVQETMDFLGFSGKMGRRTFGTVLTTLKFSVEKSLNTKEKRRTC